MLKKIFDGQSADGDSLEIENITGIARFKISGDFGGGTVNLQIKAKDASFADTFSNTGDSFTEDTAFDLDYNSTYIYRLNLDGSTAPNLNAFVEDGVI